MQHKADQKGPGKSLSGVDTVVQVAAQKCEGQGKFVTKACPAWNGHSAAPKGPVVASRNWISIQRTRNEAHAPFLRSHMEQKGPQHEQHPSQVDEMGSLPQSSQPGKKVRK